VTNVIYSIVFINDVCVCCNNDLMVILSLMEIAFGICKKSLFSFHRNWLESLEPQVTAKIGGVCNDRRCFQENKELTVFIVGQKSLYRQFTVAARESEFVIDTVKAPLSEFADVSDGPPTVEGCVSDGFFVRSG